MGSFKDAEARWEVILIDVNEKVERGKTNVQPCSRRRESGRGFERYKLIVRMLPRF
jgi:hypothetical protein